MSQSNSAVVLFDASGNPIPTADGAAQPVSGLPVMGSDGTNAQFLLTDTGGRVVTSAYVDTTASGALGAVNAAVTLALAGTGGGAAGFQLAAGTLIGTLLPEISFDGGTTWVLGAFYNPTQPNYNTSLTFVAANTATALMVLTLSGATHVRVRVSSFTSGTANASLKAGQATGFQLGLSAPLDGQKDTFSASILNLAPPATPTDIVTISGSSARVIRVTRIVMSGTQTTAAMRDILLVKRSTADTGGTSATATAVPHDSQSPANSTATVRSYTVNPAALGTSLGNLRVNKLFVGLATALVNELTWDFGNRPARAAVLRSAAESLCINLSSVTSAGNLFDIYIEWTEE